MKLSKKILQSFFAHYPDEKLPLAIILDEDDLSNNVVLKEGGLIILKEIEKDFLDEMNDNDFMEIWLDSKNLKKMESALNLTKSFLPKIDFELSTREATDFVEICHYMNEFSKIKRFPIFSRDILDDFSSHGVAELVVSCVDLATKESIRRISLKNREESKNILVPLTIKEDGLLVFIKEEEAGFAHMQRLVEAVKETKMNYRIVSDPREFIEKHQSVRPELVILGHADKSIAAMRLYSYLKKIDPFARLLEVTQEDEEVGQVDLAKKIVDSYKRSYEQIVFRFRQRKVKLDMDTEYKIKGLIKELKRNYSDLNHVTMAYQIYKFSMDYDVTYLLNLINSMKKG